MTALLMSGMCACGGTEPSTNDEIVVAAAANLTDVFEEMGRRFTTKTGIRVVNSFGATGDLAKQIENGGPFDLFAAADVSHVESLEKKGLLVDSSRAVYARGRLVLWLPNKSAGIQRLEDLTGASVSRIAVAKPELAPYGEASVEALRALGLWEKVEQKVVYAQNVAQAKQFASTGNAEAAFLPRSLIKSGEGQTIEVAATLHKPIDQAMGIMKASRKQESAKKFWDFVLGDVGQSILERYGYERPRG
jgi:molybdate transport system substrate-binding protein